MDFVRTKLLAAASGGRMPDQARHNGEGRDPLCGFAHCMGSRISPPRMHHCRNLDRIGADLVNQDVVRVDDGLPRSFRAPSPVQVRALAQAFRASLDRRVQPPGGRRIAICNIFDNRFQVGERVRPPDQLHQSWRAFASMIARICLIASSCWTTGLLSAVDAATLAFSQRR